MLISLLALLWFSTMNNLRTSDNLPRSCRYVVLNIICHLMCLKNYKPIPRNSETLLNNLKNISESRGKYACQIANFNRNKPVL